jgi:hypothetical protein
MLNIFFCLPLSHFLCTPSALPFRLAAILLIVHTLFRGYVGWYVKQHSSRILIKHDYYFNCRLTVCAVHVRGRRSKMEQSRTKTHTLSCGSEADVELTIIALPGEK